MEAFPIEVHAHLKWYVSPIGPFARTSNVRVPSSDGIGSSYGAAIIVSCASGRPCAHRVSIVGRSNS